MPGLLTSQNIKGHVFLVIGTSALTLTRVQTLLDYEAVPIVITELQLPSISLKKSQLPEHTAAKLAELESDGKINWIKDREYAWTDLETLGRPEVQGFVDGVFVTAPKTALSEAAPGFLEELYSECTARRIPINTADDPQHCTFTLLSTYKKGDFQLGITTSGKGCRLASRIKREAISALPHNLDEICDKVGDLRRHIIAQDKQLIQDEQQTKRLKLGEVPDDEDETGQEDDDAGQSNKFNNLVLEFSESYQQKKKQRLRWLSQIVEYYPLSKLSEISVDELSKEYKAYSTQAQSDNTIAAISSTPTKKGRIALVGSGPGSVGLLTTAALQAIKEADIILADKLVPTAVLEQIPRETPVHIAKKFPGNAERAQQEFLDLGLKYVQEGKYVVRLKQGDPYIFGRGAEEFLHFAERGFELSQSQVIPGITSALSAPLAARIPPTHRDVADQVLICTGTGRRGALPNFPEWVESRTCVFLMSLHRIGDVVKELVEGKGWDVSVPCCVIERASCPDQRVIRTRLRDVAEALEAAGSRPPGLLVTGRACEVLVKLRDDERWRIEEGLQ